MTLTAIWLQIAVLQMTLNCSLTFDWPGVPVRHPPCLQFLHSWQSKSLILWHFLKIFDQLIIDMSGNTFGPHSRYGIFHQFLSQKYLSGSAVWPQANIGNGHFDIVQVIFIKQNIRFTRNFNICICRIFVQNTENCQNWGSISTHKRTKEKIMWSGSGRVRRVVGG